MAITSDQKFITVERLKEFKDILPDYFVEKATQQTKDAEQDSKIEANAAAILALKKGQFVEISREEFERADPEDYEGYIVLVPAEAPVEPDVKEEYIAIKVSNRWMWEKLGNTKIDLSNFYTKTQVDDKFYNKSEIDEGSASLSAAIAAANAAISNEATTARNAEAGLSSRINALESSGVKNIKYGTESLLDSNNEFNFNSVTASVGDIEDIF